MAVRIAGKGDFPHFSQSPYPDGIGDWGVNLRRVDSRGLVKYALFLVSYGFLFDGGERIGGALDGSKNFNRRS